MPTATQATTGTSAEVVQPADSEEVVEQTPEPATSELTEGEEQPGAPSEEAPEGTTDEPQADPGYDEWLPAEQAKEFLAADLLKVASRYGYEYTLEQVKGNETLQRQLRDKLNSDIYIKQLRSETQGDGLGEFDEDEPIALGEDEPEEGQQPAAPAVQIPPPTPEAQREAYYQQVDSYVAQLDPKAQEELGKGLLNAFGVNTDTAKLQQMLADPNLQPEQRTEVQQALNLAQSSGKLGQTLARGATDLIMSLGPKLISDWIEQTYPGTALRYQKGVAAEAWAQLSDKVGKDQKPLYPGLPKYGTPQFRQLVLKVEKQIGVKIGDMAEAMTDNGKPLSLEQKYAAALKVVARASRGQRGTPAIVQQAIKTGQKKAEQRAQIRGQGSALGAGQPAGPGVQQDAFTQAIHTYNKAQRSLG